MIDIRSNLAAINNQIQQLIAKNRQRSQSVTVVAVSKKQPVEAIREAVAAGQYHFGENYLQEAVEKIRILEGDGDSNSSLTWHYIGAIQSNKTRDIARYFDWVHTVDRLKIAQRLSEQRPAGSCPLNICIQVNIDRDPAKAGIDAAQCVDLANEISQLPNLNLRGLMTITAAGKTGHESERSFREMHALFRSLQAAIGEHKIDTLSMGMSGDWPIALAHGATMLRIGSAIFGPRSQQPVKEGSY